MKVELLISPFCLCGRDYRVINEKSKRYGLTLKTHSLWEIDDKDEATRAHEFNPEEMMCYYNL